MICSVVGHDSSRYQNLFSYLWDQIIPPSFNRHEKRYLIWNTSWYVIIGNDLYKRGLDGTLLRCLEWEESQRALEEVYEGICGSHVNGLTLAQKLIRAGYYWPEMEKDAIKFAKNCQKCQVHGNLIHAPGRDLIPFTTKWPFHQWAFDLIGIMHPHSSNGHTHIITTTDYFTKWVEAVPLTQATGKQISMFILNYIICRYGIPHSIIIDNGG